MGFDFGSVDALDYDELRPTYALEAVRWVAERAGLGPRLVPPPSPPPRDKPSATG